MLEENLELQIENLEKEVSHERERLSSDRMDISFGELINLYKSDELLIRPEYQRLFRWNIKQKTALIESILLGIPIPPIFVAEDKDGIWELVDGLQRVSTFISFFGELAEDLTIINDDIEHSDLIEEEGSIEDDEDGSSGLNLINNWKLEAGSLVESLQGLDVNTIPARYKINLKRAVCRVEILRGESNVAMKYELFKRLNSGGSKLTPQEIRNAIYRGINPVVNELLLELSKNSDFKKVTNLSAQKNRELYDQELILRFVALLDNTDNINNNLENYLDHYLEDAVESGEFDPTYFRSIFSETIKLIANLNEEKIFRNERGLFVPAVFEGATIAVAQNIERYRSDEKLLLEKINELKNDEDFKRFSGSASNSKSRIRKRLKRANEIFKS